MTFQPPTPGSLDPDRDIFAREGKHDVEYAPTWNWGSDYLGDGHRDLLSTMPEVNGLLYPQDVLKLYELAFLTPGPILEIGTYEGLSTSIMARALRDAGNANRLVSLDVSSDSLTTAKINLEHQDLEARTVLLEGSAHELMKAAPGFRPSLVFVDGDHSLLGVINDLRALRRTVPNGGIICFHDFEGYSHEDEFWTRVEQGIRMSWVAAQSRFLGRFGISGVFQRVSGGPPDPSDDPSIHQGTKLRDPRAIKNRVMRWSRANLEREDIPGTEMRRGLLHWLARIRAF